MEIVMKNDIGNDFIGLLVIIAMGAALGGMLVLFI